jgi:hypothetical protein
MLRQEGMMQSALSLLVIVALALSSVPLTAQESLAPGPLARAMTREAVRLAAAPALSSSKGSAGSPWSKVTALAPGTEITVESLDLHAAVRHLVLASDTNLVLLNVVDPRLTPSTKRALIAMASVNPTALAAVLAGRGAAFEDIRVTPDGLFVADVRIVDREAILEAIARSDVVQISTGAATHAAEPSDTVATRAVIGAVAGLALGAAIGAAATSGCQGNCDTGGKGAVVAAMAVLFGGIGAGIGAATGAPGPKPHVIYRAP